jgi:hypothetical protein
MSGDARGILGEISRFKSGPASTLAEPDGGTLRREGGTQRPGAAGRRFADDLGADPRDAPVTNHTLITPDKAERLPDRVLQVFEADAAQKVRADAVGDRVVRTVAPSSVGSACTRKGRLLLGVSTTVTIAWATAATSASGGSISAIFRPTSSSSPS